MPQGPSNKKSESKDQFHYENMGQNLRSESAPLLLISEPALPANSGSTSRGPPHSVTSASLQNESHQPCKDSHTWLQTQPFRAEISQHHLAWAGSNRHQTQPQFPISYLHLWLSKNAFMAIQKLNAYTHASYHYSDGLRFVIWVFYKEVSKATKKQFYSVIKT